MRSLRRNAVPSFAAMATVLVTMLVLGVFIPIVQATTGAANEVRGRVLVDVYLKTDATTADVDARPGAAARATRRTSSASSTSPRSEAYASRSARATPRPTSCSAPTRCPTPSASRPTSPDNIDQITRRARAAGRRRRGRTPIDAAIDEVRNRRDDTSKILPATRVVKLTTALLAVLLVPPRSC